MKMFVLTVAIAALVSSAIAVGATYMVKQGQLDDALQQVAGLHGSVTDLEDRPGRGQHTRGYWGLSPGRTSPSVSRRRSLKE